jgi:hypothetical protein
MQVDEFAMQRCFLDAKTGRPSVSVDTLWFGGSAASTVTVTNSGSTPRFGLRLFHGWCAQYGTHTTNVFKATQGDHCNSKFITIRYFNL